jgi:hypothetical protein
MKIIDADFAAPPKTRKKESRVLVLALEAVRGSLLTSPGMYYAELERAVETKANCSRATAQRAIKLHYGDGSLSTKRDGNKKRYYWEENPRQTKDAVLPVRHRVVSATNTPKVCGVRRSPIEWIVASLMEVA